MKNIKVKRLFAYILDYMIITIIISLLTNIKAINPKYDKYYEAYAKYSEKYNAIVADENKTYVVDKELESLMFDVSYYGLAYNVIEIVVVVLYFTLFPLFFSGQTIGKKILKLKIRHVNNEKNVSFWSYLLRSIIYPICSSGLFYCVITLAGNMLALIIFKQSHFITLNKSILIVGLIWGYADIIFGLSRKDSRLLHDVVTRTEVVDLTTV